MSIQITTLSRERLEELSDREREHIGPIMGEEIIEMARALMAVMDAKPTFCIDRDSDFIKHIQKCSDEVAKWPEWKRKGADVMKFFADEAEAQKVTTPPAPSAPECEWTFDESQYSWNSACGEEWLFTDGGPEENRVKFCQGCGGTVKLSAAPGGE
jgi:hypothetical protein